MNRPMLPRKLQSQIFHDGHDHFREFSASTLIYSTRARVTATDSRRLYIVYLFYYLLENKTDKTRGTVIDDTHLSLFFFKSNLNNNLKLESGKDGLGERGRHRWWVNNLELLQAEKGGLRRREEELQREEF